MRKLLVLCIASTGWLWTVDRAVFAGNNHQTPEFDRFTQAVLADAAQPLPAGQPILSPPPLPSSASSTMAPQSSVPLPSPQGENVAQPQLRGSIGPKSQEPGSYITTGTDITSSVPLPPLAGLARITSVSASARELPKCPLGRIRDCNLRFVEVRLANNANDVAIVNGDAAQIKTVGGTVVSAAMTPHLNNTARPGLTQFGYTAAVLATAGSLALAGPIFYENLTPDQHRKRYLGTAIGLDGIRHTIEDSHFCLRVIMPGDETVGWFAFELNDRKPLKEIMIPLSFHRSLTPDGTAIAVIPPSTPTYISIPLTHYP